MFKLMYSSKTSWEYILLIILSKTRHFWALFKSISAGNWPFLHCYRIFRVALKSHLTSMTPSTTTPGLGIPPTNSRCTKQYIFIYYVLYIIYNILYLYIRYYKLYINIYLRTSDYGRGMTWSLPLSYWSPEN
jgi:hypothetical protein